MSWSFCSVMLSLSRMIRQTLEKNRIGRSLGKTYVRSFIFSKKRGLHHNSSKFPLCSLENVANV